jgi:hypothetical protein
MRLARRALVAAALLLLATAAAAGGAAHVLAPGCGGSDRAEFKPSTIIVACGDGNFFVKKIDWSAWKSRSATGSGTGRLNTCSPTCARGNFKSYPVRVVLSSPHSCPHGLREFSMLDYTYTGHHPRGVARSGSVPRPCSS